MIGWAMVTGDVSTSSILLFLLIFFWTPPHFWALALFANSDYQRAGIPMLPVTHGARHTKWQMLVYTLILLPLTVAPVYLGIANWVYGALAGALSLGFIGTSVVVLRSDDLKYARAMFGYSVFYLFALFLALMVCHN